MTDTTDTHRYAWLNLHNSFLVIGVALMIGASFMDNSTVFITGAIVALIGAFTKKRAY